MVAIFQCAKNQKIASLPSLIERWTINLRFPSLLSKEKKVS